MSVRISTGGTPKPIGGNWRDSLIYSAASVAARGSVRANEHIVIYVDGVEFHNQVSPMAKISKWWKAIMSLTKAICRTSDLTLMCATHSCPLRETPESEIKNWDGPVGSHAGPPLSNANSARAGWEEANEGEMDLSTKRSESGEIQGHIIHDAKISNSSTYLNTPNIMRRHQSTSLSKSLSRCSNALARVRWLEPEFR